MSQVVLQLRGTVYIGAAGDRFRFKPNSTGRADGAFLREGVALVYAIPICLQVSFLEKDSHELGNDVACSLDDDGITLSYVLSIDFILVVEGCIRDRDPADLNRFEFGNRCQGAGAPNLGLNAHDDTAGLLWGELVGDGPSRRSGDIAQSFLQRNWIHLDDTAIDLDGEGTSLVLQRMMEFDGIVDAFAASGFGRDDETPRIQCLKNLPLRGGVIRLAFGHRVGSKFKTA